MLIIYRLISYVLVSIFFTHPHVNASSQTGVELNSSSLQLLKNFKKFKDVVNHIKSTAPDLSDELGSYLLNKNVYDQDLPTYSVTGRSIVINPEKNIKVTLSEDSFLTLYWGKREKKLNIRSSFSEIKKVVEVLEPQKSLVFKNFLIQNAYADPATIAFYGLGLIIFAVFLKSQYDTYAGATNQQDHVSRSRALLERCRGAETWTLEELTETLNLVEQGRQNNQCSGAITPLCHNLNLTSNCLNDRINNSRMTNTADRTIPPREPTRNLSGDRVGTGSAASGQ